MNQPNYTLEMTPKVIQGVFIEYCKMNKIRKGTPAAHKAQYWFLAGVRTAMPNQRLPEWCEIIHRCGRNMLTEPEIKD